MPKTLTRHQAIRLRCLDCSSYSKAEVRRCAHHDCQLYPHRMGVRPKTMQKQGLLPEGYDVTKALIASKAIRAYCLWCCCGQSNEVRLCPSTSCPLWPFRFGKHPETIAAGVNNETRWVLAAGTPAS